jgi:hypothetical protein
MEVQFVRTGNHRYSVVVHRAGHPSLEMNPAPGYDDRMPHDLLHFVVERHLGLRRGIFGQLAAGGTAGTFHLVAAASSTREQSRLARTLSRRGAKLARDGQGDCVVSERAAQVCHEAWSAGVRAAAPSRGSSGSRSVLSRVGAKVGADVVITAEQLESICAELEVLSAAWMRLDVGQALALVWPDSKA